MLVVTTMIGSTSIGNLIFLISAPCTISTLADSSSEEENQVQGRMPLNRKRAYINLLFSKPDTRRAADDEAEDDGVDDHQQQRVEQAPEETEHGAAIARLQLARHQGQDQLAVADDFFQFFDHVVFPRGHYTAKTTAPKRFSIFFQAGLVHFQVAHEGKFKQRSPGQPAVEIYSLRRGSFPFPECIPPAPGKMTSGGFVPAGSPCPVPSWTRKRSGGASAKGRTERILAGAGRGRRRRQQFVVPGIAGRSGTAFPAGARQAAAAAQQAGQGEGDLETGQADPSGRGSPALARS